MTAVPWICEGCGEEITFPGKCMIFFGGGVCHEGCVEVRNGKRRAARRLSAGGEVDTEPPSTPNPET